METLEKVVETLTRWTAYLGQVALAAVMIVIVANIILRTWWRPLPGTVELVEILGAVILSLGVAYCATNRNHIAVGVLVDKLSPRKEGLVECTTSLLSLVFILLLAWESTGYGTRMMARNYTTGHLLIPLYPFIYLMALGFFMLAAVLLRDFLQGIKTYIKGSEVE